MGLKWFLNFWMPCFWRQRHRSYKTDKDLRIGLVQISYVCDVSFNIYYIRLHLFLWKYFTILNENQPRKEWQNEYYLCNWKTEDNQKTYYNNKRIFIGLLQNYIKIFAFLCINNNHLQTIKKEKNQCILMIAKN